MLHDALKLPAAAGAELVADYRGLAVTGITEALSVLPRALAARASKAAAAMGAAMADRSARSCRWASSSASLSVFVCGTAGGRDGGAGGVGGAVMATGWAVGSRSGILSNQRAPGRAASCDARGWLAS